jgi:outer membrane receptor protein involved in Fe transport
MEDNNSKISKFGVSMLPKIKYAIIILTTVATHLSAGITGKIAGIVRDADNGVPLPGVNVMLEGTSLGSTTDADGMYYILNVDPGIYTLQVLYIGYSEVRVTGIKVQIDLTTEIHVDMTPEILEGETVEVVAKRPVVKRDVSNSQLNIEASTIMILPVREVTDALTLQAGIQNGRQGLIIRGGGANQTIFMVDGLSQNDERSNIPYSVVSMNSVEEVQVQTGRFSAEYGQVRSGLVNVITKEGNRYRYHGTVSAEISPAQSKHYGLSLYDPYSYFNRPYLDPQVMWTGTDNGAWDAHTRAQYPNFEGWIAVSEALLADEDPENDLTPEGAKRLFEFYRRRQGDITKPDYNFDLNFGGPVPFISEKLGDLRFYISYIQLRDMFVYPLSRDSYDTQNFQMKLTSDINPAMKLLVTGTYGEEASVSPYNWTTTPTGYVLREQEQIANLTNSSNTGTSIPYMPGYYSPTKIDRSFIGVKFTHTLSKNTFYDAHVQYKQSKYNTYKTADRNLTEQYEIVPGYYVDEAPYGYYGYTLTGVANVHLGGWMNLGRDNSSNSSTTLGFNMTSQIDNHNQIKAGFQFVANKYDIVSYTESPSMSTWSRDMIYSESPYRLGIYIQDKLEFEGFIANIGLRLDLSQANSKFYTLDPFDEYYEAGSGNNIEEQAPYEDSELRTNVSPRLGVSHPITENSKLYFNYGHFVAEPSSSYRFRLQREANGLVTYIGNPNLEFEKTISYELGYEQGIADLFLLKIAGYYKDITHQPSWIYYQNLNSSVQYNRMENNNYADIRGVEISLIKRYGKFFSGLLNFTYDVRTSGYFGLLEYYEDPREQRQYLRENPYQVRPHPLPYARANIDFHTPEDYGPDWSGFHPLASWNFNLVGQWSTGRYETYNPFNKPGVVDDVQWRDWFNLNLRISKKINIDPVSVQLYIDIRNVFNFKYMSEAGFSDTYDRQSYLHSLNFSWEEGEENGNDRVGDYRPPGVAYDPLEPNRHNDPEIKARNDKRKETKSYIDMPNITSLTFLYPRDIYLGIRINF